MLYFMIAIVVVELLKRWSNVVVVNVSDRYQSSQMDDYDGRSTGDGLLTWCRGKIVNEMRYLRVNGGDAEMKVLTDPERRAWERRAVDERNAGWPIDGQK